MINRILFPTDFSDNAAKAMHFAAEVAQFTGAELMLIHAQHVPTVDVQDATMIMENAMYELKAASEKQMQAIKEKLEATYYIKNISTEVEFGFARDLIIDKSHELQIDLVIMGTKGSTNMLDNLLGSVTANVMKGLKKPLLIVPADAHYHKFRTVAYATQLNPKDEQNLDWLVGFTSIFNPDVHVLHVLKEGETLQTEQQETLTHMGKNLSKMIFDPVYHTDAAQGIENYLAKNNIELLAMRAGERGFFEALFHKSVTKHVAMHTKTPLIIFH